MWSSKQLNKVIFYISKLIYCGIKLLLLNRKLFYTIVSNYKNLILEELPMLLEKHLAKSKENKLVIDIDQER